MFCFGMGEKKKVKGNEWSLVIIIIIIIIDYRIVLVLLGLCLLDF